MKIFYTTLISLFLIIGLISCTQPKLQTSENTPSWYNKPKQNNSENLYGVSEGYSLEEATKSALADAASRLMVSISSESSILREENKTSVNEEMRQNIKQNIEKIDFTNFKVSKSEKIGQKFFTEVTIERAPFIQDQKEKINFSERQIADLEKNFTKNGTVNIIEERNSLLKIVDISKKVMLSSLIVKGAGENINIEEKTKRFANFENLLNLINSKIEFYFEIDASGVMGKEISQIIRNALNKEKIKIAKIRSSSSNQVVIAIASSSRSNKIYEAFMTKLTINFENKSADKTVASNSLEVTGSSSISENETHLAAINSLEEKISQDGILKIIGIIN